MNCVCVSGWCIILILCAWFGDCFLGLLILLDLGLMLAVVLRYMFAVWVFSFICVFMVVFC